MLIYGGAESDNLISIVEKANEEYLNRLAY
jgi:hypothetical protein